MALVAIKQGYEKKVYASATINSSASDLWWQVTDVDIKMDIGEGTQTSRGNSSAPPITYNAVTSRSHEASFTVLDGGADDPVLVAILARIRQGLAWALKITDGDGTVRFDADVISPVECSHPLDKEGTYKITAKPTLAGASPRAGTFLSS